MQNDMHRDHELIRKFQNGDSKSFDKLVRAYLPQMMGFFIKITNDRMLAEDLCQDVFLKLFKYLKKFRFESTFKTYLYRININTANTWITRNKWRNILGLDKVPEPTQLNQDIERDWKQIELKEAISRLPKKQRSVVLLRVNDEFSYSQISEITGMSEATAKVNFHHAKKKLIEIINEK